MALGSPSRRFVSTRLPAVLTALFGSLLAACAWAAGPVPSLPRAIPGLDGRPIRLEASRGGATVLVFYSSECPISNAYSSTLNALGAEFPPPRVKLIGVCADPDLSDAEVSQHAREFELKYPVARDRTGRLAAHLGAKVTPEAFVLDDQGRLRYHGRIDDQFAARRQRNAKPMTHELRDAVAAVVAGREVAKGFVAAVGCPLPQPLAAANGPTYTHDVAPILQKNCQECHRPGQVGPFPLMTYEQARKRADDLADVAESRRMPPWKPAPGFGRKFKHERTLAAAEIDVLAAWARAGAPEGDPADQPPAASFADDWTLGTPDLVLEPDTAFEVPAAGNDIYRCFVIPTNLDGDRYVSAVEYRPGNRRVVHHVLCYVDTTGEARKKDDADPGPGYSCFSGPEIEVHGDLGGWAPGNEANFLPDGVGRSLPRKADVVMQVHYHPSGKAETDRTRMGIYFGRKPIRQILHWSAALNPRMELPPGQSHIEIKAEWPVPVDLEALAVTPHMHLLGRDITMTITLPGGRTEDLIKIDDWDFNWQNTYYFQQPLDLPKGSVLRVVAHYDNSEANPRNPNRPPKLVKWGEATTDEMCIGFLAVTRKGQDLTRPGEHDDLQDIFHRQREEYERKARQAREKSGREAPSERAGSGAGAGAGAGG